MSGYYQRASPHESSLLASRNRGQRETELAELRGGGVGRVRKKEKKGREVVSCRTLDEAHARCEAARAFTRGKQEAVCVCVRACVRVCVYQGTRNTQRLVLDPVLVSTRRCCRRGFSRRIVASTRK